jgi:hypothetical protein
LSSLVGHRARSAYLPLPPWAEKDSPSSLRDPLVEKEQAENGGRIKGARKEGDNGGFYEDSATSDDSSSSESSSGESGDSSSDESSSSDNSSDSSDGSDEDEDVLLPVQPQAQQRQVMPAMKANGASIPSRPEMQVEDASDEPSSSSSGSSSSGSDEDSSSSSEDETPTSSGVGNLIPISAQLNTPGHSTNGGASSFADDFKGLILDPVVVDAQDEPKDANIERDSSAWTQLVWFDQGPRSAVDGFHI